jgi:hypothetical protein
MFVSLPASNTCAAISMLRSESVSCPYLARLRARKRPTFEFAFGLEPIVQLTAWLFAAFKIDFVCATSDVLVTRRVPHPSLFGFDDILIFYFLLVLDYCCRGP